MPKNPQWRFVPKNAGQHNAGNPPVRLQTNASSNMAWNPWLANVLAADKGVVLLQPESQTTSNDMSLDISKAIEDQLLAKPKVKACVDASYARWHAAGILDIKETTYNNLKAFRHNLMLDLSAILGGNIKAASDKYKAEIAKQTKAMNDIAKWSYLLYVPGGQKLTAPPMGEIFANFSVITNLYDEDQGTKTTDSDAYVLVNPNWLNTVATFGDAVVKTGMSWPKERDALLGYAIVNYKDWLLHKALRTQAQNALGNLDSFDKVYGQLVGLGYKGEQQYAKLKAWGGGMDPKAPPMVKPDGTMVVMQPPLPEDGPYNAVYKAALAVKAAKEAWQGTLMATHDCKALPQGIWEWAAELGKAQALAAIAVFKGDKALEALKLVEKYLAETHKLAKMLYGNKCAVDLQTPGMTVAKMTEIITGCAANPAVGSYLYTFQVAKNQLEEAQISALAACGVPDDKWPKLPMDPIEFNALKIIADCEEAGLGAQPRASRSRFASKYYKAKTDVEGLIKDRQEARAKVVEARTEEGGTYDRAGDAKKRVAGAKEIFNSKPVQVGTDRDGKPIMAGFPRSPKDEENLADAEALADIVIERSNEAGAAIVAYGFGLKIAIEDNDLDNDSSESDATAAQACAALKAQGAECPELPTDKETGGGGWMALVLAAAAAAASGAIG